jgi:hypothetical protein
VCMCGVLYDNATTKSAIELLTLHTALL